MVTVPKLIYALEVISSKPMVGRQWSYMSGRVTRLVLIGHLTSWIFKQILFHWRKCSQAHLRLKSNLVVHSPGLGDDPRHGPTN